MGKEALSRPDTQDLRLGAIAICAGCLVLCILLFFIKPVAAQNCQTEQLQRKTAELELELEPQTGPVRLHRVEELEDQVFIPRLGSKGVESPFFLYEIEQRRFFVQNGEVRQNVRAGTLSTHIAISRGGEQAYRLAGFPNSEDNFKRLVSDFHLFSLQNPTDAESRALYCARVVFGVGPKQWLLEETQARMMAADYFFHQGSKDPFRQADRWWRNFRKKNPQTKLNLTTASTDGGTYLTRLPLFWAPLETSRAPEIRQMQIQVNRDGSCHRVPN